VKEFKGSRAVDRLDLIVHDGEFFSLIGPSGCGKTTTLRILAGLEEPDSGSVRVHGRDLNGVPPYRRPVNTVFQDYALFPHLSVAENVAFGLKERRVAREEIRRRVGDMLSLVSLAGRENARPGELSGGQRQRVALARSLVLEPEVLLLDEPLGALDLNLRRQMQSLLKRIQREVGITFLYVTHDQEEAFSMSDRVAVMREGRLDQVDSPSAVYMKPQTAFVADFLGSLNRLPSTVEGVVGDDGLYRVAIRGIGSFVVPGVPGLRAGAPVSTVIRPEAIEVNPGGSEHELLAGEILDASFLGSQFSYEISLDNAELTLKILKALTGSGDLPRSGDRGTFGWRPENAWVVPG
jgi:spermidine/putrescine transport system ATP-binding protein